VGDPYRSFPARDALFFEELTGSDRASLQAALVADPQTDAALLGARLGTGAPAGERSLAWLEFGLRAYRGRRTWPVAAPAAPASDEPEDELLGLAHPLVEAALSDIRACIAERGDSPAVDLSRFDHTSIESDAREIVRPLLARTLVTELAVAHHQGRLRGGTAEERFAAFRDELSTGAGAAALLRRYPHLARQLATQLLLWKEHVCEVIGRLVNDAAELQLAFGLPEDLALLDIATGLGDPHRGRRSVTACRFAGDRTLMYKPRPVRAERALALLMADLDTGHELRLFKAPGLVDRHDYGWAEFVAHEPCTSAEEMRLYYLRCGALLGLLHVLGGTDVHNQNLVAHGAWPVLVDGETLFDRPSPREPDGGLVGYGTIELSRDTVLAVGLLPNRFFVDSEAIGIDFSGLGALPGQQFPRDSPFWEDAGQDTMHLAYRSGWFDDSEHLPTDDDAPHALFGAADDVCDGFRLAVERLQEPTITPEGIIRRFAGATVRLLFRPTAYYADMSACLAHPSRLSSTARTERELTALWADATGKPRPKKELAVAAAECESLQRGDVPAFFRQVGSASLWTDSGNEIHDFFPEGAEETIRRRLAELTEQGVDEQCWLVEAAIAGAAMNTGVERRNHVAPRSSRDRVLRVVPGTTDPVDEAVRLGDHLVSRSLVGQGQRTWVGLAHNRGIDWGVQVLGPEIYTGASGIAVFLASLAGRTGDSSYRVAANEAMAYTAAVGSGLGSPLGVGLAGWGGIAYAAARVCEELADDRWRSVVEEAAARLGAELEGTIDWDVIGGAAGGAVALCRVARVFPELELKPLIQRLADHLCATAQVEEEGIAWSDSGESDRSLGGLAHGAAGAAWALGNAWHTIGDDRYLSAALSAWRYQQSLYEPDLRNWLDLRYDDPFERDTVAWCHGAPGIALVRQELCALGVPPADLGAFDRQAVWATIAGRGLQDNHSLCHGDFGNLRVLRSLATTAEEVQDVASRRSAAIASAGETGWVSGLPNGVAVPSLLVGLSGIAYELLAGDDDDTDIALPSVLQLGVRAARSRGVRTGGLALG
jgi:type 2 lantibiotic biosynthesis protein LanM